MTVQPRAAAPPTIFFGRSHACGNGQLEYELDCERLELRRRGKPIDLRPKAIQALAMLLQQAGRLVTAEELRQELWGGQTIGWRNNLHQCMRDLRRALGDNARRPQFVETVARLGYRFVGERAPHETAGSHGLDRLKRALRRPVVAYFAGFASAVLPPASFFLLCSFLAR